MESEIYWDILYIKIIQDFIRNNDLHKYFVGPWRNLIL